MRSGFASFSKIAQKYKTVLASGLLQTGTNVKSVETAPGTGSSYHLKIYIFYVSLKHKRSFSELGILTFL